VGSGFLNNYWAAGCSGSDPKLPNDTKLLLVRATMIEKKYQRIGKNKEIVCNNE